MLTASGYGSELVGMPAFTLRQSVLPMSWLTEDGGYGRAVNLLLEYFGSDLQCQGITERTPMLFW